MKLKYTLFISALFLFSILSAQQPAFISDSLDTYINREMQRWQIPGVAIGIVKDGKIIMAKGYGVTDIDSKQKVDENTLFMIASNTKAFTATAISLLNSEGRLSFDDKVQKYMPDFKLYDPLASDMVTIRDLLCHRIGMETFQGDFLNWECDLPRKEIIDHIRLNKPVYGFRDKWGYCNAAFLTAGEIIPVVTDTTWDDYIKYHFFLPLDMTRSSTTYNTIAHDKNACIPYTIADDKLTKLPYPNVDNLGPAAAINSCVHDLNNWLLMQTGNGVYNGKQVFSADVLHETRAPQSIVSAGGSRLYPSQHFDLYGMGWFLGDYAGRKIISHDGGANGFVTSTCFIPEENLGIVILTNTDANYFFEALRYQIIESYFNLAYRNLSAIYFSYFTANDKNTNDAIHALYNTASKKPAPALELKQYTGKYKNDVYGTIDIVLEDGGLVINFSHHPFLTGKLKPLSENKFVCTYSDPTYGVKEIPFITENGKVHAVNISVNDFIDYGIYEFIKTQ